MPGRFAEHLHRLPGTFSNRPWIDTRSTLDEPLCVSDGNLSGSQKTKKFQSHGQRFQRKPGAPQRPPRGATGPQGPLWKPPGNAKRPREMLPRSPACAQGLERGPARAPAGRTPPVERPPQRKNQLPTEKNRSRCIRKTSGVRIHRHENT